MSGSRYTFNGSFDLGPGVIDARLAANCDSVVFPRRADFRDAGLGSADRRDSGSRDARRRDTG